MNSRKTLEFTDLPLIEVVLKRVVAPYLPVSLPFVLALTKSLGDRFDRVLDLEGVEHPPGSVVGAQYGIHTTGGCRLVDTRSGVTITVQRELISARWARRDSAEYPRFPELQTALDIVFNAIQGFGVGTFATSVVNVAYANRIEALSDAGYVKPAPWPLSSEWTPSAFTNAGHSLEFQCVFRGADLIDRRCSVQFRADIDKGGPWYLLLTVAGKNVEEGQSPIEVENRVHDALMDWFPQLLSNDAASRYGLH